MTATETTSTRHAFSAGLILLLASSCGLAVANLYYAQPLIAQISESLGLSVAAAGLIVTVTQVGYVLGLLFIVPLGDVLENRSLIAGVLGLCSVALLGASLSTAAWPFLFAMLAVGVCSCVVQILIPLAAHLAPDHARGRVVGTVTSGLMLGIMLSRPVASMITHLTHWRIVFGLSCGVTLLLARRLPKRQPPPGLSYAALLRSMAHLAVSTPVLWRRAAYQFLSFGAFSLFWTTVPLLLQAPPFSFTQAGVAWYGLAAVAGAVAAPLAGTLADRGYERLATGLGLSSVAVSLLLSHFGLVSPGAAIMLLVVAAILLDFGTSSTLVVSQRAVFAINPAMRARLNGLFLAIFFIGGACGSALGGWAYARGGWPLASSFSLVSPVLALGLFATEFRRRR